MPKVLTPMHGESWAGPRSGQSCDREGEATSGWHWARGVSALGLACALAACAEPPPRGASGSYDAYTQRLIQLQADQNGDGRIDQWSYLDGPRIIRGEADTDADGRIDRWEYFDEKSQLTMVGTSSQNDGIEDTWTQTAAVDGEGRVDRSQLRDRRIDRHEFYRNAIMVRTEEDTNGDGRIDRWDRYDGPVRRQTEFDTTFAAGRANRRVMYDEAGRFLRVEAERGGAFVTVSSTSPEDVRGGKRQ